MNDTMQNNEALEAGGLLDADGRVISETSAGSNNVLTKAEQYIRTEPVKAAFIALAIGYMIGRLRLVV
jgi:ElaB/YqjD/DUF883 family membrane-anchored ribosome-binding protein